MFRSRPARIYVIVGYEQPIEQPVPDDVYTYYWEDSVLYGHLLAVQPVETFEMADYVRNVARTKAELKELFGREATVFFILETLAKLEYTEENNGTFTQ